MQTNMHFSYCALLLCFSLAIAKISVKRTGWLDRLVEYHKNMFLKDVEKLTPIQINASIERIPPGYVDSPNWDYESVLKLLCLIGESKTAKPVRIALRRMLRPSRRFMSKKNSYKHFPSLKKYYNNEFYYDSEDELSSSVESKDKYNDYDDNGLIMVTNPVEARLPSGQISIKLLKEIMEARAAAARVMPTTSKAPKKWKPFNKTNEDDRPSGGGDDDAGGKDAVGDDAGGKVTGGDDAGGKVTGSDDAVGKDAVGDDAGGKDTGGDDAGSKDAGGDDAGSKDAGGDATSEGPPADTGTSAADAVTEALTEPSK